MEKNKRKLISFKMLTSHMNVQIKTFLESKTPPIVMICGVFVQKRIDINELLRLTINFLIDYIVKFISEINDFFGAFRFGSERYFAEMFFYQFIGFFSAEKFFKQL